MSESLDAARLQQIQERIDAASKGPWKAKAGSFALDSRDYDVLKEHPAFGVEERIARAYTNWDMEFIAHAREDVPALLAEVARLRQENEKLQGILYEIRAQQKEDFTRAEAAEQQVTDLTAALGQQKEENKDLLARVDTMDGPSAVLPQPRIGD